MVMVGDLVLQGARKMELHETFALPYRDRDNGNLFLPVCRTIDGYYRNRPKLVRKRRLQPNSLILFSCDRDSLYKISAVNDVAVYGSVNFSFCCQVQLDGTRSMPVMVVNTGLGVTPAGYWMAMMW